jgi:hypothetical protein
MHLRRRSILFAIAASWPLFWAKGSVSLLSCQADAAAMRIRKLVPDPVSARLIGLAYLTLFPHEAVGDTLIQSLLSSLSLNEGILAVQGEGALRKIVQKRVLLDFEQASTVTVDGWILSHTECRICALWT